MSSPTSKTAIADPEDYEESEDEIHQRSNPDHSMDCLAEIGLPALIYDGIHSLAPRQRRMRPRQ